MKELFSITYSNYKKQSQFWILAIITYSLMMTIGITLASIVGFNLLVFLFIACPFVNTFILLSIKTIEDVPVENKDVYAGYRGVSFSIMLVLRRLLKVILFTILFYFVVYLGLSFIDIIFFEQELLQNIMKLAIEGNPAVLQEQMLSIMMNNEEFIYRLKICNYIALGLTLIFFNIIGNKKIMSIIFYRVIGVNTVNYDYIVNNKKDIKQYRLFIYNVLLSLFYVIGLILAVLCNSLLVKITNNIFISYLFSCLVFFLVSSIQIPFKYLAYTYIFEYYFEDEVMKLMNELGRKS